MGNSSLKREAGPETRSAQKGIQSGGGHVLLAAGFAAIIFGVGITQAVIEVVQRERPQAIELFVRVPSEGNLRAFERDLEDVSWFEQGLRPWAQYAQFAVLNDLGEKAVVGRDGWLFYKPGVQYLIEPCPDGRHVAAVIAGFRDQLAARGIALLVAPTPGKASVYPEMLTARAAGVAGRVNTHTARVIEALKDAGVEVVDLLAVFEKAKAEAGGDLLYLSKDTHWSPEGMRLAATAVADRIIELGWVSRGEVAYDLKAIPLRRHGDILRMMHTARVERASLPEDVTCTQVVRNQTGEPYQDDAASPILVLGDSFMRIYERDEPGSGGFIAHMARELCMPLASIVNDGGASTLVRQELYRKPFLLADKKVVVWEFVERDIRFGTEGWQDIPLPDPPPTIVSCVERQSASSR